MDLLTQVALTVMVQCKEKGVKLEDELRSHNNGRRVSQEFLGLLNDKIKGLSQRSRGALAFKSKYAFLDGTDKKPTWGMSGPEVVFRAARAAILSKIVELDCKSQQVLAAR